MKELELTLPDHIIGKATFEMNKETGNGRIILHNYKARVQYVGKIESQLQLDMIIDTLSYVAKL